MEEAQVEGSTLDRDHLTLGAATQPVGEEQVLANAGAAHGCRVTPFRPVEQHHVAHCEAVEDLRGDEVQGQGHERWLSGP